MMGAYKVKLTKHHCRCNRPATHEVFNTYNASCGWFCSRCADKEVRSLKESEKLMEKKP